MDRRRERGNTLAAALFISAMVAASTFAVITLTSVSQREVAREELLTQAYYNAEFAVSKALIELNNDLDYDEYGKGIVYGGNGQGEYFTSFSLDNNNVPTIVATGVTNAGSLDEIKRSLELKLDENKSVNVPGFDKTVAALNMNGDFRKAKIKIGKLYYLPKLLEKLERKASKTNFFKDSEEENDGDDNDKDTKHEKKNDKNGYGFGDSNHKHTKSDVRNIGGIKSKHSRDDDDDGDEDDDKDYDHPSVISQFLDLIDRVEEIDRDIQVSGYDTSSAGRDVPGFSIQDPDIHRQIIKQIGKYVEKNRIEPDIFKGNPMVEYETKKGSRFKTSVVNNKNPLLSAEYYDKMNEKLTELVTDKLIPNATTVITGDKVEIGCTDKLCGEFSTELGNSENSVTYVAADKLEINNDVKGKGTLIVHGEVKINPGGSFDWEGDVIVLSKLKSKSKKDFLSFLKRTVKHIRPDKERKSSGCPALKKTDKPGRGFGDKNQDHEHQIFTDGEKGNSGQFHDQDKLDGNHGGKGKSGDNVKQGTNQADSTASPGDGSNNNELNINVTQITDRTFKLEHVDPSRIIPIRFSHKKALVTNKGGDLNVRGNVILLSNGDGDVKFVSDRGTKVSIEEKQIAIKAKAGYSEEDDDDDEKKSDKPGHGFGDKNHDHEHQNFPDGEKGHSGKYHDQDKLDGNHGGKGKVSDRGSNDNDDEEESDLGDMDNDDDNDDNRTRVKEIEISKTIKIRKRENVNPQNYIDGSLLLLANSGKKGKAEVKIKDGVTSIDGVMSVVGSKTKVSIDSKKGHLHDLKRVTCGKLRHRHNDRHASFTVNGSVVLSSPFGNGDKNKAEIVMNGDVQIDFSFDNVQKSTNYLLRLSGLLGEGSPLTAKYNVASYRETFSHAVKPGSSSGGLTNVDSGGTDSSNGGLLDGNISSTLDRVNNSDSQSDSSGSNTGEYMKKLNETKKLLKEIEKFNGKGNND